MPTSHPPNTFDFVRLVAALAVLVSHHYALYGLPQPRILHAETLGGLGVMVFFSISGFLVARSWQADPNLTRFAVRRLLRIWPAFAVAILLTALVLGPLITSRSVHDYFAHPLLREYFHNLYFDLRDRLPLEFDGSALPAAVNGSLWTIPLELQCYAGLALLGALGLARRRWLLPALTGAAAVVVYLVLYPLYAGQRLQWSPESAYLVHYGLYFFAGASFAVLQIDAQRSRLRWLLLLAWTVAGGCLAAGSPLLALWAAVPLTAVAVGTASTPGLRRAGRWGDISYGLYIYAFPVQQTLLALLAGKLSWHVLLVLEVAITAILAWLSWHIIERRALLLKPRRPGAVRSDRHTIVVGNPSG